MALQQDFRRGARQATAAEEVGDLDFHGEWLVDAGPDDPGVGIERGDHHIGLGQIGSDQFLIEQVVLRDGFLDGPKLEKRAAGFQCEG